MREFKQKSKRNFIIDGTSQAYNNGINRKTTKRSSEILVTAKACIGWYEDIAE